MNEGTKASLLDLGGVGVGTQALSADARHHVHEASVVLHALLRPGGCSCSQKHRPVARRAQNIEQGQRSEGTASTGGVRRGGGRVPFLLGREPRDL